MCGTIENLYLIGCEERSGIVFCESGRVLGPSAIPDVRAERLVAQEMAWRLFLFKGIVEQTGKSSLPSQFE